MKGRLFETGKAEGVTVEASFVAGELVLVRPEGAPLRLSLERLDPTIGGDDDAHVVLTARDAPGTQAYLDRADVVAALDGEGVTPWFADRVREGLSASRRRWAASRSLLLGLLVTIVLAVVLAVTQARALALRAVPAEWEVAVGDLAWEGQLAGTSVVDDPELLAFVEATANRLLDAHGERPYPFKFHVARDAQVNAFAFPGGHVVVNTGLIAAAGDPDEVAGVLAHELAHVLERHSLESTLDKVGVLVALGLLTGSTEALAELHAVFAVALELSFSREHEREADRVGLRLLHEAGLDPRAIGRFFDRLARESGDLPGGLAVLSTHPTSAERSTALEAMAAELPPRPRQPLVTPEAWAALQARAGAR